MMDNAKELIGNAVRAACARADVLRSEVLLKKNAVWETKEATDTAIKLAVEAMRDAAVTAAIDAALKGEARDG